MLKSVFLAAASLSIAHEASAGNVDFNRDIRPLFSKHCTSCHGGVKAAGKISFVYREKALAEGKSGEICIVPGKPEESELIRRITSEDKDEVMPKPDHGPRLSEMEVSLFKDWIKQGAVWSEHWAFVPPKNLPLPALKQAAWPKSGLDAWILARLEAKGLAPSSEAAPQEWLRRVSLDLTGLPPTLGEFEEFEKEFHAAPQAARERVVDRLLASPHYGERWATVWLDLARYADSYGFEADRNRIIWPWRDWVIRAFNADMTFEEFTVKQLAGDLLPNPTGDDLLATAFHRNTQNNTEGGTDDEEYRTAAVLDRVGTTWTAWQATTFACVQCHSHPYDPFPHEDFYRFAAFFNNAEDTDLNDDFPKMAFPEDPKSRDEAARLTRERRALREAVNEDGLAVARALGEAWEVWTPLKMKAGLAPKPVKKDEKAPVSTEMESLSEASLSVGAEGLVEAGGTLPIGVVYALQMPVREGVRALRLQIFMDSDDLTKAAERGSVLSHLKLNQVLPDGSREPVKLREVIADYIAGPYDPQSMLNENKDGFGSYPVQTGPRWCVVTLESPLNLKPEATLELVMEQSAGSNGGFQGVPLRRFKWWTSTDERWTALSQDGGHQARSLKLAEVTKELNKLGGVTVPVIVERSASALRPTRVFVRGNRMTLDKLVPTGIPQVARPPEKKDGLTRLDMARWLVSEQNTLTARVLANRLWAELFGQGIVPTLEDFGTSGERPTHPELLDHLALRLMKEHRWSLKSFLRELALSATYAQTSKISKSALEKDARNVLLSRGPRVRLTAEMVRDQALAISGLLAPKLFGPPVYPPQPEGIWKTVYNKEKWDTSQGEDRYRRGVYTYCKRTSGYPEFITFDAPMRDTCTARRIPTNTPLQALVTLNDPAFLEAASALADRMLATGGSVRDQIANGCRFFTLSAPPPGMVDTLLKLHGQALAESSAEPKGAMTLVANTLLNMDAAMVR